MSPQGGIGQFIHLRAEPCGVSAAPGEGRQIGGEIQVYALSSHQGFVHLEGRCHPCAALKALLEGVHHGSEVPGPGILGLQVKTGGHKEKYEEETFHFFCLRMSHQVTKRELRTRAVTSAARSRGSPLL